MSSELVAVTRLAATHVALQRVESAVSAGVDCIHDDIAEVDVTCRTVVPLGCGAPAAWCILGTLGRLTFHHRRQHRLRNYLVNFTVFNVFRQQRCRIMSHLCISCNMCHQILLHISVLKQTGRNKDANRND